LALVWLAVGNAVARIALIYAVALVGFLAVAVALEHRPANWGRVTYDGLSIVHLYLLLLLAGVWFAALALERQALFRVTLGRRLVLAGFGVAWVVGLLWLVYPAFFGGPMVAVPPEVLVLWQQHISEFKPAIDPSELRRSLRFSLLFLGPALPALAFLPFLLKNEVAERRSWGFVLLALIVFSALALYQIRWGIYAQILALPVYVRLLQRVLEAFGLGLGATGRRSGSVGRAFGRAAVILAFAVVFTAAGWFAVPEPTTMRTTAAKSYSADRCDVPAVARYLSTEPRYADRPRRIMSFIFLGPELLYRTGHQVVANPNHRNAAGILDTIAFFSATDAAAARSIAARRRLDLVVVCAGEPEAVLYRGAGSPTLYDALMREAPPAWLRPVALPAGLARGHRLLEVVLR
jgi:hypothetical protein